MFKRKVNITRLKKELSENLEDTILIEQPIDIYLNSNSLVNIICLPKDLKELTVGFLYSIGLINKKDDIKKIKVEELENKIYVDLKESASSKIENLDLNPISRVIDTSCGITSPWRDVIKRSLDNPNNVALPKNNFSVKKEIIFSSIKQMQKETILYRETGGCHGAATFTSTGDILCVKEDIGRHNAIDKVIGAMLLKDFNFKNIFLTSTGRLTGDSVLKVVRANIPLLASVSAAIESGIRLAFSYGITLIGFVRGERMNIYTHAERVVF